MGLDNGVYLLTKDPIENIPKELTFPTMSPLNKTKVESHWNTYYESYKLEIAYWRKCWNVRSVFFKAIEEELFKTSGGTIIAIKDNSDYELTPTILRNAIKYYIELLTPENWQDEEGSIWEFAEIEEIYKAQIKTLEWALKYLEEHTEDEGVKVVFYDSY